MRGRDHVCALASPRCVVAVESFFGKRCLGRYFTAIVLATPLISDGEPKLSLPLLLRQEVPDEPRMSLEDWLRFVRDHQGRYRHDRTLLTAHQQALRTPQSTA